MSSFQNINLKPKLTPYLVDKGVFDEKPFVVVDVGSRGGYESHWNFFRDKVAILGFDPDKAECERLKRLNTNSNVRYFPYALLENYCVRKFYLTKNEPSSSFFKPERDFWKRLADGEKLIVTGETMQQAVDLDTFAKEHGIGYVDFIKLDIEGAELAALKGASNLLNKSVLGISTEISFTQTHRGRPIFADIDVFLRNRGFMLFDLGLVRLRRKAGKTSFPSVGGQVVGGHALYLRDFVNGERLPDSLNVLKAAALFEIFGLNDCAIELISSKSGGRLLGRYPKKTLVNLLKTDEKFTIIERLIRRFRYNIRA